MLIAFTKDYLIQSLRDIRGLTLGTDLAGRLESIIDHLERGAYDPALQFDGDASPRFEANASFQPARIDPSREGRAMTSEKRTERYFGPDTYPGKALRRLCAPPLVEEIEQRIAYAIEEAESDLIDSIQRILDARRPNRP